MRIKVVSLDIWNTILKIHAVFKGVAKVLAPTLNISEDELLSKLLTAYSSAKQARRRGELRATNAVKESLKIMAAELGIEPRVLRKIVSSVVEGLKPEEVVIDGALEAVKELNSLGVKVVTLGNVLFWRGIYTRHLLENLGFSKYITAQFYADELGVQKPDRKAFLMICRVLNVEPHEVIHVGDGIIEDFGGALSAGFRAALVTKDVDDVVTINEFIHFIPSIEYLPKLVRNLIKA